MVFRGGSAQTTQLFDEFFARTELLSLAGVDYLVPSLSLSNVKVKNCRYYVVFMNT